MFSLKNRTAAVAMTAGLALTLAACGGGEATSTNGSNGGSAGGAAAEPTPAAQIDQLSSEQTAVVLDASFLEGITGLGLTPGMIGSGTLDADTGTIAFPITGGNVTYFDPASGVDPYVQGLIEHEGSGLSLTGANGVVVELENFEVDPEQSLLFGKVTVDGEVFAERADLFVLDGSTLNPLRPGDAPNTAVLQGTTVSLTETAADALNTVFETDALAEFFLVGVAEITVNTG
jgi:hypothetical protein